MLHNPVDAWEGVRPYIRFHGRTWNCSVTGSGWSPWRRGIGTGLTTPVEGVILALRLWGWSRESCGYQGRAGILAERNPARSPEQLAGETRKVLRPPALLRPQSSIAWSTHVQKMMDSPTPTRPRAPAPREETGAGSTPSPCPRFGSLSGSTGLNAG